MDRWRRAGLMLAGVLALAASAARAETKAVLGAACTRPAADRCTGEACTTSGALARFGTATDPSTGRQFFLDYFDKYRLVVATPTAATSPVRVPGQPGVRVWVPEADDAHLQGITTAVIGAFGRANIRAFWLAGHSQGGLTSNRIVCTPFFASKVDGWLSLSGGRIGRSEMNPRFGPPKPDGSPPDPRPIPLGAGPPPQCEFSHIYETGEHEIVSLPATSPWADKYGCRARVQKADIVDDRAGYVWDYARQGYPVWGLKARPGKAEEWVYPGCREGRVVADVVRLDKGHTEGLEPNVTETLVKLIVSAPGGKIARGG